MNITLLEVFANLFTVICVVLAGRNNIHTWWTGIVGCVLFGILFFKNQLYADVTLQVFFVITSIIGWLGWATLKYRITTVSNIHKIIYSIVTILVAVIYGSILKLTTDAYAPFVDSLVLTFSILAQLLLMNRKIENWPAWVLVNTISVPLYFSRELYLTAGVYTLFWFNAVYSWYNWNKIMQEENKIFKLNQA